ncbi:hypothetical protein [Deinococcus yavapaiensis]|uniref:Uncharacterized protein n=1 Tax=Deinococcus yavapaiensis KR-236 TaxID=694435 RepID=A0A318SB00_9DEIO|nr:hypothetical protein [Deinococcus yavapaiensis]PYE53789.1 hypothetical protein DES52_10747 [Deinococcus yavapaiensis KR-236]
MKTTEFRPTPFASSRPVSPRSNLLRHLPAALSFGVLSTAFAAPGVDLKGAVLCLSPLLTVTASTEAGLTMSLVGLDGQAYADVKTLLRAGGVRYREEHVCKKSDASLNMVLEVRPIRGSASVETRVSTYVENETKPGASSWLGGELRWSAVSYGKVNPTEAEVRADLLKNTRSLLNRLVSDWKSSNR